MKFTKQTKQTHTKNLAEVGFDPTPPERLVPKTSALDHSATYHFFSGFILSADVAGCR